MKQFLTQHIYHRAQTYAHNFINWIKTFEKQDPETAFYPGALEVLESPPSPLGRTIALVICCFFVFTFAWACLGKVDIIATAQGKIIPTGRTKIIQPLEAGVVKTIHIRDGQKVNAGDILIEIDTTISEAERDRLHQEHIVVLLEIARLKAALKIEENPNELFKAPETASFEQIERQRAQLLNQVQEIQSKLTTLDQQIAQQQGNHIAVQETIKKLTKSIPLLKEKSKLRGYLSDKGYGSKLDSLSTQQDLIEHEQELLVQRGRLTEATAGVAALKGQRQQAESEYKHGILEALSQAEQKASSLHEQLVQATERYRLQTLTAPVSGTVQQLAIHTEGGVVTPAQALLSIVPSDSRLEIEAMISNRDIGFVQTGEDAEIKVDTFNFTKYGFIHGKVLSVSNDAITRQKAPSASTSNNQKTGAENETSEPDGQELVYATRISMDRKEMIIDGRTVNLSPGMAITAEIKTGSRRVIEFLLSPLFRHQQQAMHER